MRTPPDLVGTKVLLVDNYSSFSHNLAHYIAEVTGELPLVVTNDVAALPNLAAFHAIVLSPGPGSPANANDFGVCSQLLEQVEVPVLGICLGHQGLGVVEGATLSLADEPYHGRTSVIEHDGDALFDEVPSRFAAARYHSLILRDPLPASLRCIARTTRGEVMALRHATRPHLSVQFHPESIASEFGHQILANFCRFARSLRTVTIASPVAVGKGRMASTAKQRWRAVTETVEDACSPEEVFERLYADSDTAFWLDGSSGANYSYFGDAAGPHGYRIVYDSNARQARYSHGRSDAVQCTTIFEHLDEVLEGAAAPSGVPPELEFAGGFVGYFGYELKGELGAKNCHSSSWPDAEWIWVDRFLAYDHQHARLVLVALHPVGEDSGASESWLQRTKAALGQPIAETDRPTWPQPSVHWRDSHESYAERIEACKRKIIQGESYELCLTTQLEADARVHDLELFQRMRRINPAPYAALLRCSAFSLASASPERFLHIDAGGVAESKPIKGTARRDPDPVKDRELAKALATSEKECAENLMIVDLVRHDLAKTCAVGSVEVTSHNAVESYSTVHQLVSTVRGKLAPGVRAIECVAAAFPGGSMTGAPKKRSMEILDELETGPRGPYSGSIGYLSMTGAVNLSIVIRSIVVEPGQVHLGVGGAITALSNVAAEVLEVDLKAKAQIEALRGK
tara:strand:+ start:106858 stop:108912 length:2055 start_codon:yes stop_codon:yes gene_type:complete